VKRQVSNRAVWRIFLLFFFLLAIAPGLAPRPHRFSQALRDATRAYAYGVLAEATQYAAQAAEYAPWRADLWEAAGRYALWAGDLSAAIDYLKLAELSGDTAPFDRQRGLSAQGWRDLGDAYWQSGDRPQALHAWQMELVRFGASGELLDRLAQAHYAQGDYAAALANLQALALLEPADAELHYRLGLLLAAQAPPLALEHLDLAASLDAQYRDAASAMRRAVVSARMGDDPAYTLLSAGRALASLGEWDLAAEAFRQATLARPEYAQAWAYLGEALQHVAAGSPAAAAGDGLEALQKSVRLDSNSIAGHSFLGLYWTRRERYDLAKQYLQAAIRLDPQNPALQAQLASTLAAASDLAGAYMAYQKAVELAPRDPLYRRALIEFSLDYNYSVHEIALPLARQLLAVSPDDAANLALMGRVMLEQDDLASAERFLLQALRLDPGYAQAHLWLGQVYILQNNHPAAYQEFRQAAQESNGAAGAQAQRLIEAYFP
jgi:tetratricopeptide (TPR) repeat protein